MCKLVTYIQGVSVAASVYSLVAVSVDRLLAIWCPLRRQITRKRALFIITVVWAGSLTLTLPWALYFDLIPIDPEYADIEICQEVWPSYMDGRLYFVIANLLMCYLLPLIWISCCYILIWIKVWNRDIPGETKDQQVEKMQQRSKLKVVKMLVVVVAIFMISWLPLYVIFLYLKFGGMPNELEGQILAMVTPVAQWLGASNSCINPILYAFFNKKYRRGFVAIMKSCTLCRNPNKDDFSNYPSVKTTSLYYSFRSSTMQKKPFYITNGKGV